jgi:N-acetyl sugar amidotransferase
MLSKKKKLFDSLQGEFKSDNPSHALYNLPTKVEFCKTCLMSNQKPCQSTEHKSNEKDPKITIKFIDGICHGCFYKEKKQKDIDWEERKHLFKKIMDKYRSRNGSYDIVVPGSGGKDSFKVAHELKYNYNMNPITCTFAPSIYTVWGYNNLTNWINAGFSNYNFTLNGKVHRLITRLSIDNLLHPFQPWILGQRAFPNKFAALTKVPLVIYGENPGEYEQNWGKVDYGEDVIHELHSIEENEELFIAGYNVDLLKSKLKLSDADIDPYIPMTTNDLRKNEIKCITWSYFHPWHPQGNYYYTREHSPNFQVSPMRTPGTYQKHASLDDKLDDLHYFTAYVKFGIGRAHYDASQEIRSGDISLEEGRKLIRKFSGEYPKRFMKEICEWLTINPNEFENTKNFIEDPFFTEEYFLTLCDKFKSPHLWKLENNKLRIRHQV